MICCYTELNHQWSEQELTDKLLLLPDELRNAALRKRLWLDRQLYIAGKLLLLQVLKKLGLNRELTLADLKYNAYHRPYFDADMDFNIAHSGYIVMCCGTLAGKTGIDIEQVNEIDLGDYTDYFTKNEWGHINKADNSQDEFYYFWTRKEAVLKAIGTGFHTPLSSVDVSGENLVYDDVTYHLYQLDINDEYKCHIACTEEIENIRLIRVNL
jgi:4'-phosphopantetheinyl transferase